MMKSLWQPVIFIIILLLIAIACISPLAVDTATEPPPAADPTITDEPAPAETPTSTAEPVPVLIVEELDGFEPRSVVFSNVEYIVTGVRLSNQELRSYAAGGEPVIDEDNFYAYLDITAVNRMNNTMTDRLEAGIYKLVIDDREFSAADQMSFLSDLTGFIRSATGVDSFLAFPVPADVDLRDAVLVIGSPPDRRASLPLTGPVPEPIFPIEVEIEGSAEGVGPTNNGDLLFTVFGATLYEDKPHEHTTSPTGLRANEDELFLVVHLLVENRSARGGESLGSTSNAFRLLIDGIPRAPWDVATHPSGSMGPPTVFPGAAEDAWVAFLIPVGATEFVLQVGDFGQNPGLIPLDLPELP